MILESNQEREAFKFICSLADELTSSRGCNDLTNEQVKSFEGLTVKCDDDGKIIDRPITMDFDVLFWLREQTKLKVDNLLVKIKL